MIGVEITGLIDVGIELIGVTQDGITGADPLILVLLQGAQHLVELIIAHAHTHPAAAIGEGVQSSYGLDGLVAISGIDADSAAHAPADQGDVVGVHFGLVLKKVTALFTSSTSISRVVYLSMPLMPPEGLKPR